MSVQLCAIGRLECCYMEIPRYGDAKICLCVRGCGADQITAYLILTANSLNTLEVSQREFIKLTLR